MTGLETMLVGAGLLFCRIGACLMLAPGTGASQVPTQVRLFVALGVTLALAPLLLPLVKFGELNPIAFARLIVCELLTGAALGALARLFFAALETLGSACANMLSLANPFGMELEQAQPLPPLATLVALGATTLMFVANLHWQVVAALVDSYDAMPFGAAFDARRSLSGAAEVLAQSFVVAIRVASPFFLYSVIVNFGMALINRATPQIQVFFLAPPFVLAGGGVLLYFTIRPQESEFVAAFGAWLANW